MIALAAIAVALAPTAHAAATKNVAVRDDFFRAKSITVNKGTRVRWVWKDKGAHNVAVQKGPAKFSSSIQTKGTYSKKLTKKGTYRILCTVHAPSMKMTVRVK
jgi:plastocyanin